MLRHGKISLFVWYENNLTRGIFPNVKLGLLTIDRIGFKKGVFKIKMEKLTFDLENCIESMGDL